MLYSLIYQKKRKKRKSGYCLLVSFTKLFLREHIRKHCLLKMLMSRSYRNIMLYKKYKFYKNLDNVPKTFALRLFWYYVYLCNLMRWLWISLSILTKFINRYHPIRSLDNSKFVKVWQFRENFQKIPQIWMPFWLNSILNTSHWSVYYICVQFYEDTSNFTKVTESIDIFRKIRKRRKSQIGHQIPWKS